MAMCHVAQENGVRKQSEYIDRNKVAIFTHPKLHDVLSKWQQIYIGE